MCGRFALTHSPDQWPLAIDHNLLPGFTPRYNIAPSQHLAVVVHSAEGVQVRPMQWGFVPHWVHEDKPTMAPVNARLETAADKPMFRAAMAKHRCLVPASGFYEWQQTDGGKQPWYIHPNDGGVFLFAGLYSRWQHGGEITDTVALLTQPASAQMAPVHARMPVRVRPEAVHDWLENPLPQPDQWQARDPVALHPVSTRVNSPSNNDQDLITPLP